MKHVSGAFAGVACVVCLGVGVALGGIFSAQSKPEKVALPVFPEADSANIETCFARLHAAEAEGNYIEICAQESAERGHPEAKALLGAIFLSKSEGFFCEAAEDKGAVGAEARKVLERYDFTCK